jgi:hypothetical protein
MFLERAQIYSTCSKQAYSYWYIGSTKVLWSCHSVKRFAGTFCTSNKVIVRRRGSFKSSDPIFVLFSSRRGVCVCVQVQIT